MTVEPGLNYVIGDRGPEFVMRATPTHEVWAIHGGRGYPGDLGGTFVCAKSGCHFGTRDLGEVAAHVVANQFDVR